MARPNQEAIQTFMTITGVSESVAVHKIEEHGGDLNEAVNAHFSEGDGNITHEAAAASQNDMMDIDDPIPVDFRRPPFSLLSSGGYMNPFSLIDPNFGRSLFDSGPDFASRAPFVSHPREVREIPIEVKDGSEQSGHHGIAPTIEDVTGTANTHDPEIHGTVTFDDDDDKDISTTHAAIQIERKDDVLVGNSHGMHPSPSVPGIDDLPDYINKIEEEMIQAAIEASKRDAEKGYLNQHFGARNDLSNSGAQQRQSHQKDAELVQAVSLSSKGTEQGTVFQELGVKVGASEQEAYKFAEVGELGKLTPSNGRLEVGSSSIQDDTEDVEEQPLVRHRNRHMSSDSVESARDIEEIEASAPSSPGPENNIDRPPHNGNGFPSDEWGGISSEEHDEAVMLEAALFGGIPEGGGYHFAHAPHQFMQNGLDRTWGPYSRRIPRPPSPGVAAQRLLREQQDDEYLASLQADREKELRVMEEAEARHLEEQAAREAALEEQRQKEEESCRKIEEEQKVERQLVEKEASLPRVPKSDDENAVTLLVRMPDGSRRCRRFFKSDKLQALFDFIDVGRGVKPGNYRLVRPFPRHAFSDGESALTLNELGLTSKQEALFLELI
ncbi:plant UBX domain-containing protein 8-like isoform X2 [Cornus florida]|uniref:plant UBX domain-containing protein 8-like isoform X2 n=1 Tax=Cornus florida TaxID=4283 RepID=UPI0028983D63|nr:plant UBX domain-containing protein 8-like isoform X2 [Cornus florida]